MNPKSPGLKTEEDAVTTASISASQVSVAATPHPVATDEAIKSTLDKLKDREDPEVNQPVPEPVKKVPHVVNGSSVKATVKLRGPNGKEDYIHVMGRRHVKLPEGFVVDQNYKVLNKHITVVEV